MCSNGYDVAVPNARCKINRIDIQRLIAWWSSAAPWIQGALGGAGVTMLWEGLLKPRRERRSLAHVLAQEVEVNLQLAQLMKKDRTRDPRNLPPAETPPFETLVYRTLLPRLGELPSRIVRDVLRF